MITPYIYALLSKEAYSNPKQDHKNYGYNLPNGWKYADSLMSDDGYFGLAVKNKNEIVIIHRGTDNNFDNKIPDDLEVLSDKLHETSLDAINDIQLWLQNKPLQYKSASNFVKKIINKYPDASITITGHSLGGLIAKLTAINFKKKAVVFDSPGEKEIVGQDINQNEVMIEEYNSIPNVINSVNQHITKPFLLPNITVSKFKPALKGFLFLTKELHNIDNIIEQFDAKTGAAKAIRIDANWPSGVVNSYKFFISYDLNSKFWDNYLYQNWNKNYLQASLSFSEYKNQYIKNHLDTKSKDITYIIDESKKLFSGNDDIEKSSIVKSLKKIILNEEHEEGELNLNYLIDDLGDVTENKKKLHKTSMVKSIIEKAKMNLLGLISDAGFEYLKDFYNDHMVSSDEDEQGLVGEN